MDKPTQAQARLAITKKLHEGSTSVASAAGASKADSQVQRPAPGPGLSFQDRGAGRLLDSRHVEAVSEFAPSLFKDVAEKSTR